MPQSPKQAIGNITLIVDSYDKAIDFFTTKLLFTLLEDIDLGEGKRWVRVMPPSTEGAALVLHQASNHEEHQAIGNQSGGLVFLFLKTNNFWRDYESMKIKGVEFDEEPRKEKHGTVVVFRDLCGNKWDLIQPSNA